MRDDIAQPKYFSSREGGFVDKQGLFLCRPRARVGLRCKVTHQLSLQMGTLQRQQQDSSKDAGRPGRQKNHANWPSRPLPHGRYILQERSDMLRLRAPTQSSWVFEVSESCATQVIEADPHA